MLRATKIVQDGAFRGTDLRGGFVSYTAYILDDDS
jgi:hypothetical protein